MPLTRIRQTAIGNDSITSAKLAHDLDLDGDFVRVPHGTTAERPSSPVAGYMRFNTDQGTLEQWNTTTNSWQAIDSPPIITSLAYSGSSTAADPAGGETITLTGTNFKSGANVTIGGTSASSVSVVNSTTITFTTPVKTAGDYDVVVINSNGLQASLTNGISYNGTPAFTTAAGNLGSISEDVAMSTITIVAAEPDGGTLAYSVTSGALPTGVSLGSANGQLTGTPNTNVTSDTTFNFTVTATDDENQTNARAFNLIVLRPIYATQISNSLRFNDDDTAYLTRTFSSGNQQIFTLSGWIKRSTLGLQRIFSCGSSGTSYVQYRFDTNDNILISSENGAAVMSLATTQKFRDVSAWYHLTLSVDTTQATASNRVKLYVNGEQVTDFSTSNYPTQNTSLLVNSSIAHYLGALSYGPSDSSLDGYMSDVYFVDGQALTPTSFAEEYYGVWVPKAYSGTYGTNGFKLDFSDSSNLGDDTSGNTNDFTANGLSARDSVPDSPTTNFATFNYNNFPVMTFAEGALQITTTTNNTTVWGTQSIPDTGKWYFEMEATNYTASGGVWTGLGYDTHLGDNEMDQGGIRLSTYYGGIYLNNTQQSGGYANQTTNYTTDGDVYSFAIDMDNELFYIGRNGTWFNSADPSAGTGGLDISANITAKGNKPYVPALGRGGSYNETYTWNFGQDSTFAGNRTATSNADANNVGEFAYTVPTNFLSLCAKNLSESTINTSLDDRPEDYFDAIEYTGNATARTITDLTFQPDLLWIKVRDSGSHYLVDSVRGSGTGDSLNPFDITTANPETYENLSSHVTALTSNGFSLGDNSNTTFYVNRNSELYSAWAWKAGGAPTATNSAGAGAVPTAGSVKVNGSDRTTAFTGITSPTKQSVNTKTGFSITQYVGNATGSGAANSVDHGLNEAPEMIWIKELDGADSIQVYSKYLDDDNSYYLQLVNTNAQVTTSTDMWNGLSPTNSVFHLGYEYSVNQDQKSYIAYSWHSVPGFSKFGKYTGNNNTPNGTYIHLGFKPAFFMIKEFITGGTNLDWHIFDNTMDTEGQNPITISQRANKAEGDVTGRSQLDFLANGVKHTTSYGDANSGQYVFMAFAEDPFKYSEAR